MKSRPFIFAALMIAGAPSCFAARSAKKTPVQSNEHYAVVLTTDMANQTPASEFNCRDKIYAYLRLPRLFVGRHHLKAAWFRPDGKLQETSQLDLDLLPPGQNLVYAWLQCHVPDVEDTVDIFFNSDDGAEFDGAWRVDFYWDGKKVKDAEFTVVCE